MSFTGNVYGAMSQLHKYAENDGNHSAQVILAGWREHQGTDYRRFLKVRTLGFTTLGLATVCLFAIWLFTDSETWAWAMGGSIFAIAMLWTILGSKVVFPCETFNRLFERRLLPGLGLKSADELMSFYPEEIRERFAQHLKSKAQIVKRAESEPGAVAIDYEIRDADVHAWARRNFSNELELGQIFGLVPKDTSWKPYFQ